MDEVEHRRRRTRGRTGSGPEPAVRRSPAAEARPTVVTPSDIADRAGADRAAADRAAADRAATDRAATVTDRAVPDQHPPTTDRPLPFDAHSSHPAHDEREGERGLRGLVGGGSTQVSVAAAMRARDAARPTEADLADAASSLTIVHRGWVPRDQT